MIAAAGYLSYTHSSIGDEGLTQTSAELTEEDYDIVYDETLVDADIFAETQVDTKLDDTAADGTKTDDAKAEKRQSRRKQKIRMQMQTMQIQTIRIPTRQTVKTRQQQAVTQQKQALSHRIARSAIRVRPCLQVQAYQI